MVLTDENTNTSYEGIIKRVEDAEVLKGHKDFTFEWHKETGSEIYKLTIRGKKEILGLLSIRDIREEFRVHINLIESSIKHRGKKNGLRNIPGCLIGHACQIAFRKGYGGFVSLTPKTYLIDYYQNNYGFIQVGRQLATFGENSKSLMAKYLDDEEI
jgi:transposase-like protein